MRLHLLTVLPSTVLLGPLLLGPLLLGTALPGTAVAQDARRHALASPDQGLPRDAAAFCPYHDDPQHLLNQVFRLAWLQQCIPAEVAAVLPREGPAAWREGWVHQKRAGTEADRRWFGGDGRQLPLETFSPAAATSLTKLLGSIGPAERAVLMAPPELAVLFQHDLLRIAQRLLETADHASADPVPADHVSAETARLQTRASADLLPALWRVIQFVALDAREQARLRDPLSLALSTPDLHGHVAADLPASLGGSPSLAFHEVLRRSTRLFDAEKTLLWSRVFLAHPNGAEALAAMLPQPGQTSKKGPTVPIGCRAVLVQGIVAIDANGKPYATPVTFDVRTQVLANRDGLSADNATFTHDGIDFGMLQLEREGLRRGEPAGYFRQILADDQELFRDYGTQKHTTYRAQCALCHRTTGTPEPELGGFPVLRPHAAASLAQRGDERLRLAEEQVAKLLPRLAAGH